MGNINLHGFLEEVVRNVKKTAFVKGGIDKVPPTCIIAMGEKRKVISLQNPIVAIGIMETLPAVIKDMMDSVRKEGTKVTIHDVAMAIVTPQLEEGDLANLRMAGLEDQLREEMMKKMEEKHRRFLTIHTVSLDERGVHKFCHTFDPHTKTASPVEEETEEMTDKDADDLDTLQQFLQHGLDTKHEENLAPMIAAKAQEEWCLN